MRQRLVACLVVLALSLPTLGTTATKLYAVQPIQENGATFCTTFAISTTWFLSAGHCAQYAFDVIQEGGTVTILGLEIEGIYMDTEFDLAVFEIPAVNVRPFKIAGKEAKIGDELRIEGFPYGLPKMVTTWGRLAAHKMPLWHPSYHLEMPSDVLDITVAGGNSGSPVLNKNGQVIGVLWGGFNNSPHSLSVPHDAVVSFLKALKEAVKLKEVATFK